MRAIILSAAFVTCAFLTTHQAEVQADGKPAPPNFATVHVFRLLAFIEDPAFQKELALSPQQIEKLIAERERFWKGLPPAFRGTTFSQPPERTNTAAQAMEGILNRDQFQRANELARQIIWFAKDSSPLSSAYLIVKHADPARIRAGVLAEHPEIAEALKLSDDQRKLLPTLGTRVSTRIVLLTPEQTETARALLGRIVNTTWKSTHDPHDEQIIRLWTSKGALGALQLLRPQFPTEKLKSDLRTELKITDEQEQQLAAIRKQYLKRESRRNTLSSIDAKKQGEELAAQMEKELAAIFNLEQLKRIRQLTIRNELDPSWRNTDTPLILGLTKELEITAAQRQACEAVIAKHVEAVRQAVAADKGYAEAHKAIRAANRMRDAELEELLTAKQKAALKELVGEPFLSRMRPDFGSPFGSPRSAAVRAASFGHYTDELELLAHNQTIQGELKFAAEQRDSAQKAGTEMTRKFGFPGRGKKLNAEEAAQQRDERKKFLGDSLASILDSAQRQRFREIMMQEREHVKSNSASRPIPSAVTYPGVAEAVRLTNDQKKRLLDGEHPVDVLTDDQRMAIHKMLGERFTGNYATSRSSGFKGFLLVSLSPFASDEARAAFMPYLPWEATKFTPDEITHLVVAITQYQIKVMGVPESAFAFPPRGKGDAKRVVGQAISTLKSDTTDILVPRHGRDALTRIDQLALQSAAAVDLPQALASVLELTARQSVQFADAEEEAGLIAELVGHARLPIATRDEILRQLRDQLDQRILAQLAPDQLAKWKSATGERFAGFTKSILRGPPRDTKR